MKIKLLKNKMNKKGIAPIPLVLAVFLGIIFLIFLTGGGIVALFEITKFIKNVPTFVWVILGVIVLFKIIGGKKRR